MDAIKESHVTFQTAEGAEARGSMLRLTRHSAILEVYGPNTVLQASAVLDEFRIICQDRTIYSGRAVVRTLLNTGVATVCEVTLEDSWLAVDGFSGTGADETLNHQFDDFIQSWQKLYRVRPEFKIVVADFQSFLTDLRLWLEQVELAIRSSPSANRIDLENQCANRLTAAAVRAIDGFIERFEAIAADLEEDLQPAHRAYLRRQLHPLVLCSPFAYRAFYKPLGYAGDYQMVDMMFRAPQEGSSLFAKIINVWLLGQTPVLAHRDRVTHLAGKLTALAAAAYAKGKTVRVFNLGCGPAVEVQRFLMEQPAADGFEFTLLDFNEETLQHVRARLDDLKQRCGRRTAVRLVRKSVSQLLKEAAKSGTRSPANQYDFICCAGLFDYLSDQVCKRLMNILYESLAPGGLLLATNVSDALNASKPFRYSMEYILDWHLVYRDGARVASLAPDGASPDNIFVHSENTGVNIFIEVRKPAHASNTNHF